VGTEWALRVPAFGEHPDRDDALDRSSRFANLADSIDLSTKKLRTFNTCSPPRPLIAFAVFLTACTVLWVRFLFFLRLGLFENFGIDMQGAGRAAKLVNMNLLVVDRILHPGCIEVTLRA
jgi:hypothetical protein